MIVLDANILIRAVLGRRVRQIIENYHPRGARFFAPEIAFEDAHKYLPAVLRKHGKPHSDVGPSLQYLKNLIEPIGAELYGNFESEARLRLRGRDENDWPVLATALGLSCGIWTEDSDFFGTGVPVWTSNRVEIFLKQQSKLKQKPDE